MRLILAMVFCLGVAPAWAGDSLVADPAPRDAGSPTGAAPTLPQSAPVEKARPDAPAAAAAPYPGISEAPLFGRGVVASAKVDESALRFYAAQKDRTRVDAEIKRLTMLHPAWKPPANLYAVGDGRDEQPLWDLYAAGRFDDVRLAIRNRERQEPGWRPSADLLAKLERREAARTIETLGRAKQWTKILELANAHPDMVGCTGMEVAWRVVDAFAGVDLPQRAFEVDAAILNTCKDRHDRMATVRKAVGVLPPADVERLIGMGATLADGSREFDPVRLDLARQLIGDMLAHAQHAEVAAETLAALSDATVRSGDATDAGLLGWYQFSRQNWAEADGWFRLGLTGSAGDVKLAEGHALSLSKLGRTEEAVQLAAAWRDHSEVMRRLFVDLFGAKLADRGGTPVDPGMLADYAALLVSDKNVPGAQALAWHDFDLKDWAGALDWFDHAASWTELAQPGTVPPEKVLEGTILALRNAGRAADAEDMAYRYAPVSPAARELTVSLAISALSAPAPAIPAARLDRMTAAIRTARAASGAAALGWRQLREGRAPAAVDWFRTSIEWGDKTIDLKVTEGLVLALQTAGRLAEAEQEAYPHIDESSEIMAAYRAVMVAQLTGAGRGTDVGSDRLARFADAVTSNRWSDGAEALGWYRVRDLDCGYALDWFRAASAWSPDPNGSVKTAEGYAQALERLGDDLAAADLALQWAPRSPEMKALYASAMAAAITRPYPMKRVAESRLAPFADLVRTDHLVNGAQALAWYRYRDAGNGYAVDWFAQALAWAPDSSADAKTVEGYAAALRDLGRLGDAEDVLFPWVDRVPAMRDMYLGVVVSELTLDDPPEPLPAERLARFADVATPIRSAKAAQAVGWYRLARHEYADAVTWFRNAVDWWPQTDPDGDRPAALDRASVMLADQQRQPGPVAIRPEDYRRSPRAFAGLAQERDRQASRETATAADLATTVMGYVLALRGAGRDLDAEDLAYAWRERSPPLARLFVDLALDGLARADGPALDPARLKRYADVIEALRAPTGAAGLAWSSFRREDWTDAAVWFKAAIDWRAPQSTPDAKLVGGYVDALRRAGRTEEAFAVAANWRDSGPEFRAAYLGVAFEMLAAAGQPGSAAASVLRPDQLADIVALAKADPSRTGAATLGWYYYGTHNPVAALAAFKSAIERSGTEPPDPKAVEGLALSLRAANRTEDALTFIAAWQERIPALRETLAGMTVELLGRKDAALSPELAARLAAMATAQTSATSAGAFGWYAYGRQDWSGAARWFKNAMEWSPDHIGPDKLLEGYALSLRNLCRFDEAESLVAARMDGPEHAGLRAIYVDGVGEQLARAGHGQPPSSVALQRFAAAVVSQSSAGGAEILGWYSFRTKQFAAARAWFERSLAWHPSEAAAFGVAMTARKLGDPDDLATVALRYGPDYPIVEAVRRVGIAGRDALLPRLDEVAARRGACGAARPAARGQTDAGALLDALPMSQRSMRGSAEHLGEALALSMPGAAASVEARAARRVAVAVAAIAEPASARGGGNRSGDAAAALNAKDYARCLALLDRPGASPAGDAQQIRGWCLLGLDRAAEAAEAFRAAQTGTRQRNASASAVGEALSLLRVGDTGAAIAAANRGNLSAEQRATVGAQVLAQQAYAAYRAERWRDTMDLLNRRAALASETRDLTMLRGWALYQSGDYDDAKQVFTAMDQRLSDAETRKALAVVSNASQPRARQ